MLLLAEGYNGTPTGFCELHEVRNAEDLARSSGVFRRWTPLPAEGKWSPSLLPTPALEAYLELQESGSFTPLESWGDTTLGMVSGNNRYFAISPARAAELGIPKDELLPLSPPGSRHLRGMTLSAAAWRDLRAQGAATYLFRPPGEPPRPHRPTSRPARPSTSTRPTSARSASPGGACRCNGPRTCS